MCGRNRHPGLEARGKSLVTALVCCLSLWGDDTGLLGMVDASRYLNEAESLTNEEPYLRDMSIDPEMYIVGPGDVFTVTILDIPSKPYSGTVDRNCGLLIHEIGYLHLGPVPLPQAKDAIQSFVGTKLESRSDIHVVLSTIKSVSVTVTGGGGIPGTYSLPGNRRLLDAVKLAHSKGEIPSLNAIDFRSVTVHNGSEKRTYDLLSHIYAGDSGANPYVYPGDQVHIPWPTATVKVAGVLLPRSAADVPIKKGETARELLLLFGFPPSADTTRIVLKRRSSGSTPATYTLTELADITLQDGDVICVAELSDYGDRSTATVSGEVLRPGVFPVSEGNTTVGDLLNNAGRFSQFADSTHTVILRAPGNPGNPFFQVPNAQDLRLQLAQSISMWPQLSMSVRRAIVTGDYSVVEIENVGENALVRNGDILFAPRMDSFVYVSGSVGSPGGYLYEEEHGLGDYIDKAGGYTKRADKRNSFLLRPSGRRIQLAEVGQLNRGDIVVVPEKQQYTNWNLFRQGILVLGSVASTIFVVVSIAER